MGLGQVRKLTHRTQGRIQAGRPFRSLGDFLARVDPRPVEAENLIKAGALEGLGTIPALLRQLAAGSWRGGQMPLFDFDRGAEQSGEDWTLAEKVAAQEAVLGAGVSAHRLELAAGQIAAAGAMTTLEAAARVGSQVRLAGMRQSWARGSSQHGEVVYSLSLEDLEGMLDVLISGETYRRSRLALDGRGPYLVEGVVEMDVARGEPVIRAERITRLEQP
jgi:error-prone DNA polymerase